MAETRSRKQLLAGALLVAVAVLTPDAAEAAGCEPSTRVVSSDQATHPEALSARGHAVTLEAVDGPNTLGLVLHFPDGSGTRITDAGADEDPIGADDVSRRGVVVGTERVQDATSFDYVPWVFRADHVTHLATPGRAAASGRIDYLTAAVHGNGSVAGVKTSDRRGLEPTSPGYVAKPLLWPQPSNDPIVLDLPKGAHVYDWYSQPLIDFLGDGSVTAVVQDDLHRYLAVWVTPGGAPELRRLRDNWIPSAIAGQWVIGEIADGSGRTFARSWTEAMVMDGDAPLEAMDVSSHGSFAISWDADHGVPWTYVGDRDGARTLGFGVWVFDMTASFGTQLLTLHESSSAVVTCASGYPEAPEIEVKPVELRR